MQSTADCPSPLTLPVHICMYIQVQTSAVLLRCLLPAILFVAFVLLHDRITRLLWEKAKKTHYYSQPKRMEGLMFSNKPGYRLREVFGQITNKSQMSAEDGELFFLLGFERQALFE